MIHTQVLSQNNIPPVNIGQSGSPNSPINIGGIQKIDNSRRNDNRKYNNTTNNYTNNNTENYFLTNTENTTSNHYNYNQITNNYGSSPYIYKKELPFTKDDSFKIKVVVLNFNYYRDCNESHITYSNLVAAGLKEYFDSKRYPYTVKFIDENASTINEANQIGLENCADLTIWGEYEEGSCQKKKDKFRLVTLSDLGVKRLYPKCEIQSTTDTIERKKKELYNFLQEKSFKFSTQYSNWFYDSKLKKIKIANEIKSKFFNDSLLLEIDRFILHYDIENYLENINFKSDVKKFKKDRFLYAELYQHYFQEKMKKLSSNLLSNKDIGFNEGIKIITDFIDEISDIMKNDFGMKNEELPFFFNSYKSLLKDSMNLNYAKLYELYALEKDTTTKQYFNEYYINSIPTLYSYSFEYLNNFIDTGNFGEVHLS